MKKIITFSLSLLMISALSANSRYLQAQLFYAKFYSPVDGPYVETYLSVVGSSVVYQMNENNKFQAKLEVTMIFSQEGNVVNFDKYELLSPEIEDTTTVDFNFLHQQRFTLPNGIYDYEIQIRDINGTKPPFKTNQTVELDFPADKVTISGIELVESIKESTEPSVLTKSGYDLVPYVYNFFPDRINTIRFYAEIYNTLIVFGEDGKFVINYFIESYENEKRHTDFVRFKRETAEIANILFAEFDIEKLASGNYNLVIEVRDKQNELVTFNKLFFQRSNPDVEADNSDFLDMSIENSFVANYANRDTLLEYIHCLLPISTEIEKKFVKYQIDEGDADVTTMQRYFLNFWLNRDELSPEYAWKQYLTTIDLVDEQFGYPGKKGKKGYETDMGRIYLKYGPPNTITDRPYDASTSGLKINDGGVSAPDGGSVPYQIWHYYTLNNQRNKKFVFANPNLASYDYVLIHSNVPGEINNENWQDELSRIKEGARLPDGDRYDGQSGDFYNNPR
nr:GWxTD domain-containing protein [Bacteroidota bacterium]